MTRTAAIIGGGVIGGGWAARFALMGWHVRVFDPDPEARRKTHDVLAQARRSLPGLYDAALPPEGEVTSHDNLPEAIRGAEWIQESIPERLQLKRETYKALQVDTDEAAIIGSSTSGFKPSELQDGATRPGQIIVTHPFNPVYLLPLVEVVGTDANAPGFLERAKSILAGIGMYPLHVRQEIDAHIADRFLEAVWREALWLIKDGIATTEEIDDAIRMGFGLRWAQMGLFETYRIAGGEVGMRHFIEQFGPALAWPWTRLMDVPDLDQALIDKIAQQSDAQSGGKSIRDLERQRDNNLVAMMRALKTQDQAAGALLRAVDSRLLAQGDVPRRFDQITDLSRLVTTLDRVVPVDWTDYNAHMNEAKYLQAFGDATDRFMEIIGCDAEYIATGGSYFTAETHIRHIDEVHAGKRIRVDTQVLLGAGKKMHLFHTMYEGDRLIATGEHFLLHVSLATRKPADPAPHIQNALEAIAACHARLPVPDGAGRAVGQPR